MTTKTPEQLFLELGEEFTQLTIDTNAKLILAVDDEDYETAAKHRDLIKTIIENTVQMSMMLLTLDETTIRESFSRQNEIVYNALLSEYNNDKTNN